MSRTVLARLLLGSVLTIAGPAASAAQPDVATPDAQDRPGWQEADAIPGGPLRLWHVVAWRKGFAALGTAPGERMRMLGSDATVWLSEDGSTWRAQLGRLRVPTDRVRVTHLAAHHAGLMAFGTEGARLLAWRSDDGRRWRRVPDRPVFWPAGVPRGQGYSLEVLGAVADDDRIVVSGWYGAPGDTRSFARVWTSRDGRTWRETVPDLTYPNAVFDLGLGPDGFQGLALAGALSTGCEDDATLPISSEDGLDWVVPRDSEPLCRGFSMAFDDSTDTSFMLSQTAGEDPALRVLRSREGQGWTEVYTGPSEIDGRPWSMGGGELLVSDGVLAVVGEGSVIDDEDNEISVPWSLVSDDGETWRLDATWPASAADANLRDVAVGHGRLVAVATDVDGGAWYADLDVIEGVASGADVDLGPLAVITQAGAPDAGLGPGTLSIDAGCVTFKGDRSEVSVTLVWPSESTSWQPDDRRVVFEHHINGTARLTDGDRVTFGGQDLNGDSPEAAEQTAAWLEEVWVQPPDPSCPTLLWHVGEVRLDPRVELVNPDP